jgi:hypothetical protein
LIDFVGIYFEVFYVGAFTTKPEVFLGHWEALLSFGLPLLLSCRYFEREVEVLPISLDFLILWILAIGQLEE